MQAATRRKVILDQMDSLQEKGINCFNCVGHCCTAVANSMQTTALETQDILHYLRESQRWTDELKEKLQANVQKFRLDAIPGNGKRNYLRKTYDCPFFEGKSLGCSIPKEVKPYGCLGFNPTQPLETEGKSCRSDQKILIQREESCSEEFLLNNEIKQKFKLWWDKLPLPLALLEAEKSGM